MSSDVWAMGLLRKHSLKVDFFFSCVSSRTVEPIYWGPDEDCKTFEQALDEMVKYLTGGK